jgi:predicted nucleic acid-binding protein
LTKRRHIESELWQHVIDSSSLINIQRRYGILALRRRKGAILLPRKVAEEVAFDPRVSKLDPIKRFVEGNPQIISDFRTQVEEEEYLRILKQPGIGQGEAAAMAIAISRQLPLVIDEKETKATGKAKSHGIYTLTGAEFIGGSS